MVRCIIKMVLLAVLLFTSKRTSAQGIIQSLVPANGLPGQQQELVIRASRVQFSAGLVTVSLGNGITVNYVTVSNSLTLRVGISIDAAATTGFRTLRIVSSGQVTELEDAFEIIAAGGSLHAILEIVPALVIHASDFDPENPQLAPLLFKITVLNDNQQRNLKVVFSLLLEGAGLLGKAIKKLPNVAPNAIMTVDNRQFDDYEFSPASKQVETQVQVTGVLPAGNYTYLVEVFDERNNLLASAQAENTLTNQGTDLILIAPGNPSDAPPDIVPSALPVFQWISSANLFDLALYMVTDGQTNTQQILQTLPVFKQLSIPATTFLYPASAEKLLEGKTYAWQIRGYINSTNGNIILESPLYWFTYASSNPAHNEIIQFKVVPEQIEVVAGQTQTFRVEAMDAKGNTVNINPTWKVTPSTDGNITPAGIFTAGNHPRTVAVSAVYGTHTDYSVVKVVPSKTNSNGFDMLYQLYGNPANIKPCQK